MHDQILEQRNEMIGLCEISRLGLCRNRLNLRAELVRQGKYRCPIARGFRVENMECLSRIIIGDFDNFYRPKPGDQEVGSEVSDAAAVQYVDGLILRKAQ